MKGRIKGFSLIELLVVITIMVVLAGVLYPVLRRAQSTAKQAVCTIHFREVGMAAAMYLGDNDDRYMPATYGKANASSGDRKWPQLLQPYVKDAGIFRCPGDATPSVLPNATFDEDLVNIDPNEYEYEMAKRTNLGLNYMYIAPIIADSNGQWQSTPRTLSEVDSPTRSILFVDSSWELDSIGRPTGGGSYLIVPPCRYVPTSIGKDDTMRLPNSNIFFANNGWEKDENGIKKFGGAYPWHQERMSVLYMDIRAIPRTPEHLAKGCDIQTDLRGDIVDIRAYDWDFN